MPTLDLHHRLEETPQNTNYHRRLAFQGILLIALLGFSILTYLASTNTYFAIDLLITRALQARTNSWLDGLMIAVSWPGYALQSTVITSLLILLLWAAGFYQEARMSILAAIGASSLNLLIKIVIQRPRPSIDLVIVERQLNSFSFPSGHVMFYTTFFGFIFYLTYARLTRSWYRTVLMIFFGSLVLLVGPSRIYLGEHWASDVLGGYLSGGLILLGIIHLYRKGNHLRDKFDAEPALTLLSSQGRMRTPEGGDE